MKLASALYLQLHFPIARNLLDRQSIVLIPLASMRILFMDLFCFGIIGLVKWDEDEKFNANTNWLVRQIQTGYC